MVKQTAFTDLVSRLRAHAKIEDKSHRDDLNEAADILELNRGTENPGLVCYGCAHSASSVPFPGKPSGERPCCFCVRNADREIWVSASAATTERNQKPDDEGTLRDFNPYAGNWYNGSPAVKVPMDCYSTMDMIDQEIFWDNHPEYRKSVHVHLDGSIEVVKEK